MTGADIVVTVVRVVVVVVIILSVDSGVGVVLEAEAVEDATAVVDGTNIATSSNDELFVAVFVTVVGLVVVVVVEVKEYFLDAVLPTSS